MRDKFLACLFAIFACFLPWETTAQIQEGGLPYSFTQPAAWGRHQQKVNLSPPSQRNVESAEEMPARIPAIGEVLPTNIDPSTAGEWAETPEGGKLWRCTIAANGAAALSFYFKDFHLPEGAKLFCYNQDRSHLLGAFTHRNNRKNGHFATGLIQGNTITLEYYEPPSVVGKGHFRVEEVGYFFPQTKDQFNGAGRAGDCNVNIGCEEGELWQGVKGSVVRILIKLRGRLGWCTGTLLNNAREDFDPIILTAQHCALNSFTGNLTSEEEIGDWVFYFNYETSVCQGAFTNIGLDQQSISGATVLAESDDEGGDSGSDFLLLRLSFPIPAAYDPIFAGWSRNELPPRNGVTIHHPEGDVKKISTFTQTLTSASFGEEVPNTHWEVNWSATLNGHGVTEAGSSGSPLFNEAGQVVGTLTGGSASCSSPDSPDQYGKFSYHWSGNGTAPNRSAARWLDPDNTGALSLRSIDYQGDLVTSILETDNGFWESVVVYPNPNQGQFALNLPESPSQTLRATVYNAQGIRQWAGQILPGSAGAWKVEMGRVPPGMYILRIEGANRARSFKVVVE